MVLATLASLLLLGQASAQDVWIDDLLARLRYPFAIRRDTVLMWVPGDLGSDPPRIDLGAWLYHVGADVPVHVRPGTAVTLPFAGMTREEGDRYRVVLQAGDGQYVLRIRLEGVATERGRLRLLAGARRRAVDDAAPPWQRVLADRFLGAGYAPGPSLRIVFENLPELLGTRDRRAVFRFLQHVLLPACRARSAARTRDPGGRLRGRRGLLRRAAHDGELPSPNVFHSSRLQLPDVEPLDYLARGGDGWRRCRGDGPEAARRRRLVDRFLDGLRWPLPALPAGLSRVLRPDDTWQRHGLGEHRALDAGSTAVDRAGRFFGWPAGTPVRAPHAAARPVEHPWPAARAWLVEVDDGDRRLRVLLCAYHLREKAGVLAAAPGGGHWRSADPLFRSLGLAKGNHVHLELVGLHDGAGAGRFARGELTSRWAAAPPGTADPGPALVPLGEDPEHAGQTRFLYALGRAVPAIPGLHDAGGRLRLGQPWRPGAAWTRTHVSGTWVRPLAEAPGVVLRMRVRGTPARSGRELGAGPVEIGFTLAGPGRPEWLGKEYFQALAAEFLSPLAIDS